MGSRRPIEPARDIARARHVRCAAVGYAVLLAVLAGSEAWGVLARRAAQSAPLAHGAGAASAQHELAAVVTICDDGLTDPRTSAAASVCARDLDAIALALRRSLPPEMAPAVEILAQVAPCDSEGPALRALEDFTRAARLVHFAVVMPGFGTNTEDAGVNGDRPDACALQQFKAVPRGSDLKDVLAQCASRFRNLTAAMLPPSSAGAVHAEGGAPGSCAIPGSIPEGHRMLLVCAYLLPVAAFVARIAIASA